MILAVMARKRDGGRKPAAEPAGDTSGSLADAISAHLELKQEHGADSDTVEQERQSALAPARRDPDSTADSHSAPASPPVVPEQAQAPARPSPPEAPLTESAPPEHETEAFEPAYAAEPSPAVEPPPAELPPEPVLPTEDTGNFEFDWEGEAEEPLAEEPLDAADEQPDAPDVLEQTPEFFEETPEYDRLWFEERPPRDFDF